ncbi:MAG TPA: hypothetical protein VGA42_09950, partial [Gemmatimonadales bacterium]
MNDTKRPVTLKSVWRESRELIHRHRRRLALGMALMLVSRLAGRGMPASSKFLVDRVLIAREFDLLFPLAAAVFAATVIQAVTGFALSQ